ncbi:alpha/beta hydrolase [Aestuariicoccus sp. MJ-SS9]|uniref:alpha/beta hydrolase n=1 Tax=Aestuariicoccus sp. MJ-SS9 TaxID=3079855 RepID=UPI002910C351|nr:alpha/beta hydrolase [Aestuariicoccus sp. MJ-SS9]MDU8913788.1 alpha/beta hydrolase [Aestuariicoccus sp. MJ-SS9]
MLADAPLFADLAEGPAGARAFWLRAGDGVQLRVGHFPSEGGKGTVLLFPGRTEYIEKYGRTAADLAQRGYHTLTIDWRGQGLADRLLDDKLAGHVHHFDDYQKDVAAMLDAARDLDLPRPFHLLAHSMGGCIGLRAVLSGLPAASATFSAPMWGIAMSGPLRPAAWALSWSGAALGFGHVYTPGTRPSSYVNSEPFAGNLLTRDEEMWNYMRAQTEAQPELQLGGPSLRWLHQALSECRALAQRPSPTLPCLTLAGTAEAIVDADRIAERMDRWPGGAMEWIEGGQHECLMEDRATRTRLADRLVAHFGATTA